MWVESDLIIADLKSKTFKMNKNEKKNFNSVFALILLSKLKIIINIPVIIINNRALVDLISFDKKFFKSKIGKV